MKNKISGDPWLHLVTRGRVVRFTLVNMGEGGRGYNIAVVDLK